jgi:hypothetical protein
VRPVKHLDGHAHRPRHGHTHDHDHHDHHHHDPSTITHPMRSTLPTPATTANFNSYIRKSRKRHFVKIVISIVGLAGYLSWGFNDSKNVGNFVLTSSSEEEELKMEQQRVKYCEIDDIVYGNWTVNRDFEDYDDIFKAYGLQVSPPPPRSSPFKN